MSIRQPRELFRLGSEAITQVLGKNIKPDIPVFIGNPTTQTIFVEGTNNKDIFVHQFGSDPAGATIISASGVPKDKLIYGQPILIKETPNGAYRFVGIDAQADEIYSNGVSESHTQEPVYLNQIRWGTMHPTGALSVLVVGAFYDDSYVGDLTTATFDGTATDTSAATISVPTTNNRQIAVMVQVDATNGTLEYKQSAEYNATISQTRAYNNGLLPVADANRFRVGYVFLKAGMSAITYGDIWQAPEYVASGGGSSEWQVVADTDKTLSANTQIVLTEFSISGGTTITIEAGAIMRIIG